MGDSRFICIPGVSLTDQFSISSMTDQALDLTRQEKGQIPYIHQIKKIYDNMLRVYNLEEKIPEYQSKYRKVLNSCLIMSPVASIINYSLVLPWRALTSF